MKGAIICGLHDFERNTIEQRLTLVHRDRNTYLSWSIKLELLIYEEKQAKNNSLLWYCKSETSVYRNNLTVIAYLSCKY